jgi:aryl-alcohol dehydrogenase-like predicted oxidoreductase
MPDAGRGETRLNQQDIATDLLVKSEHGFRVAAVVGKAASELGCSPAQLALAWQRTRDVTSVILGARTPEQLEDNLASLDVDIPAELTAVLEDATRLPDEYPRTFIDLVQQLTRGGRRTLFLSPP